MTRRSLGLVVAGVLLLASAAGGLTYAFWSQPASASVAAIRSGSLDVELVGPATWADTSPGTAPHDVPLGADGRTAAHLATPGDAYTVTQRFRTTLDGANLRARVAVDWQSPPSLPAGVTASYRVTSSAGAGTGTTALGTSVELPGGGASLASGSATWTVTVTLRWTSATDLVVPADALASGPAQHADLGTLLIELHQVRDGDGFES